MLEEDQAPPVRIFEASLSSIHSKQVNDNTTPLNREPSGPQISLNILSRSLSLTNHIAGWPAVQHPSASRKVRHIRNIHCSHWQRHWTTFGNLHLAVLWSCGPRCGPTHSNPIPTPSSPGNLLLAPMSIAGSSLSPHSYLQLIPQGRRHTALHSTAQHSTARQGRAGSQVRYMHTRSTCT